MNRLVGVQTAGGGTVTYAYDPFGRRVAKTVNGQTTRYVFDGQNVLAELDGSGSLLAANTHVGLDQLLARTPAGGATYFIHADALGSTLALTDGSGNVAERYRYSAFGKLEVLNPDFTPKASGSAAAPLIPFTFTGREWEPEAGGLYFFRQRFYSPTQGRFVSRDPLAEGGGLNLYAYCGNSPINATDPLGLCQQPNQKKPTKDWFDEAINSNWMGGDGGQDRAKQMTDIVQEKAKVAEQLFDTQLGLMMGGNPFEGGVADAAPNIGSKLEYMLGNATGNLHNIERSQGMLRQLESVGLYDTPATRQYLTEALTSALQQPGAM